MKKGKILLYTLVWWLLGFVLGSVESGTVYELVSRLETHIDDFFLLFGESGERFYENILYDFFIDILWIEASSEYLISFILLLIFYLIVEKKVLKS